MAGIEFLSQHQALRPHRLYIDALVHAGLVGDTIPTHRTEPENLRKQRRHPGDYVRRVGRETRRADRNRFARSGVQAVARRVSRRAMSSVGARLVLQIGHARRSSEGSTSAAVWIADPVYHDATKPEIVAVGRLGQCPAIVDVFPVSTCGAELRF